MKPRLSRRQALTGLIALPLAACGETRIASPERSAWLPPQPESHGLMVLLIPGLSLSDVLVPANEGALPNLAGMLRQGLLIEGIVSPPGLVYSLDEVGRALLSSWHCEYALTSCLRWDLGVAERVVPIGDCETLAVDGLTSLAQRLRLLVETGSREAERVGARNVVLADDGLLCLQADGMMIDERQPGFSEEWAWMSAQTWHQALLALDATLGWLLRRLDISAWSLALVSTCNLWPVFAALNLTEVQASWCRALAGGAIAEVGTDATWPTDGIWAQVQIGRAPKSANRLRLVAPEGYCFLTADQRLPRATPRPGGFFLGLGQNLPDGVRLQPFDPFQLGRLLARLAAENAVQGA